MIDQLVHILVKSFVFRQDLVGRKVAGMKKTIFDPTYTHNLALKSPNKEFFKQHLLKKDRNHIIINFVT